MTKATALPVLHVCVIASILLTALAVRLAFAPMPGLGFDVGTNQGWGRSAVELGLARSYKEQVNGNQLPNYPPFSIMLFAASGHAYRLLFSQDFSEYPTAWRILIKMQGILADIGSCALFYFLLSRWRGRLWGYAAGFLYALHPAAIYNSAVWGQTDGVYTFFLLAAVTALLWRQWALVGAAMTLALLVKAQAVILVPLVAFVLLLRPKALLSAFVASLAVLNVVLLPFALGGSLPEIWHVYTGSVGYYPVLSSAAYNFWWALFSDASGSTNDHDLLFGLLQYRTVGFLIVGTIVFSSLALFWRQLRLRNGRHRSLVVLFLLSALAADAFFLFNTEMHERYLFPFVALGFPMAFLGGTLMIIYVVISCLYWWNLMGYLQFSWFDRILFETFPALDVFIASMQVCAFVVLVRCILRYRSEAVLAQIPSIRAFAALDLETKIKYARTHSASRLRAAFRKFSKAGA